MTKLNEPKLHKYQNLLPSRHHPPSTSVQISSSLGSSASIDLFFLSYFPPRRSEKLKGIPKKVELVVAVKYFFRKDWDGLVQRWGGGVSGVKNEAVHEADE